MRRILKWVANDHELTLLIMVSLLAIMLSFTATILDLVKGIEFIEFIPIVLLASIVGWLVAKRAYPAIVAFGIGVGTGLIVILGTFGRLLTPFIRLLRSSGYFLAQASRARWIGPPDLDPLHQSVDRFLVALSVIFSRIYSWIYGFLTDEVAYDVIAVGIAWSMLLWIISFWIIWSFHEWGRPFVTVSPPGAVLGAVLAFAWANPNEILPYLGAALFLVLFTGLGDLRSRWESNQVDYPSDVWLDIGGSGVFLIVIVLGMALIIPSIKWDTLVTIFRTKDTALTGQTNTDPAAIGLEIRYSKEDNFQSLRYGGLPRDHLIGSGPDLDERIVMTVRVSDGYSEAGLVEIDSFQPFYWRSLTFERYTGRGWANGPTQNVQYSGSDIRLENIPNGYRLVQQEINYFEPLGGLLHVAGQVGMVDEAYEIAWRYRPNARPEAVYTPVEELGDIFGVLINTDKYRVQAYVPLQSEEELRTAGSAYPLEIKNRYLSLPEDLPTRVLSLARDLTATVETPYERALTIEAYLRTFPYNLDLPAPPPNRDVVDYFLFDLQEGYCDYYATSMVVLARAAGIPARLVMGYAAGEFDETRKEYLVAEADAHSWVEIYFPGKGWIEFEPTAGLPAITRPATIVDPDAGLGQEDQPDPLADNTSGFKLLQTLLASPMFWLVTGLGLFVMGGTGLAGGVAYEAWRYRKQPPPEAVKTMFQSLYHQGRLVGIHLEPGITANEFEAILKEKLAALALATGWAGDLSRPFSDLRVITRTHTRSLFSRQSANRVERDQTLRAWLRLQWLFLRARIWRWRVLNGIMVPKEKR